MKGIELMRATDLRRNKKTNQNHLLVEEVRGALPHTPEFIALVFLDE